MTSAQLTDFAPVPRVQPDSSTVWNTIRIFYRMEHNQTLLPYGTQPDSSTVWNTIRIFLASICCRPDGRTTTLQKMWNSLTIPWRFAALLCGTRHVKCYSYHARTSTKYLHGCKYAAYNKQLSCNFFLTRFFPWLLVKSLTFSWQLSNSPTFPGFPDKWSDWDGQRHRNVIFYW